MRHLEHKFAVIWRGENYLMNKTRQMETGDLVADKRIFIVWIQVPKWRAQSKNNSPCFGLLFAHFMCFSGISTEMSTMLVNDKRLALTICCWCQAKKDIFFHTEGKVFPSKWQWLVHLDFRSQRHSGLKGHPCSYLFYDTIVDINEGRCTEFLPPIPWTPNINK